MHLGEEVESLEESPQCFHSPSKIQYSDPRLSRQLTLGLETGIRTPTPPPSKTAL